jgi:AcrR family transcriptional regulator
MKKDKSETKEKIFNAVNDLYKTEGIDSLTLEKIAKRAGISKGGLLYHFPSKDSILAGLVERNLKEFVEGAKVLISELDDLKGEALHEKLEYFVDCYVDEYFEELEPGILAIFAQKPEFAKKSFAMEKKVFNVFMQYFDDPEEIILLLLAMQGYFFVKAVDYDFMAEGYEKKIKKMVSNRLKSRIKKEYNNE